MIHFGSAMEIQRLQLALSCRASKRRRLLDSYFVNGAAPKDPMAPATNRRNPIHVSGIVFFGIAATSVSVLLESVAGFVLEMNSSGSLGDILKDNRETRYLHRSAKLPLVSPCAALQDRG